jgi:hypothetical protein
MVNRGGEATGGRRGIEVEGIWPPGSMVARVRGGVASLRGGVAAAGGRWHRSREGWRREEDRGTAAPRGRRGGDVAQGRGGIWSGRGRRGNFTKSPDALAIAHLSGCATMRLSNGAPLGVCHCLFMSGSKE